MTAHMPEALNEVAFDEYVKRCTRRANPQSYRDAFDTALDAVRVLEQPDDSGHVPAASQALVDKFWQTTAWLGVYQHFNLSLDDFFLSYKRAGSKPLQNSLIHIKRIAEAWGPDFWRHLRRRRIRLKAVPPKNLFERLHKASRRGVSLAAFAGGLSRWLAEFYARPDRRHDKRIVEEFKKGTYTLQPAALNAYHAELGDRNLNNQLIIVEEEDPADSDDESDESDVDDTGATNSNALADELSGVPSVQRRRGDGNQPLDNDNDIDSALGLNFDSPTSTRANNPVNSSPLPNDLIPDAFDDSIQLSSFSFFADVDMAGMAGATATERRSTRRSQSEAPGALHGTPQQRQSTGTPRTARVSSARVSKPTASKPRVDPAQLRQRLSTSGSVANQLLVLLKQAHAVVETAKDNTHVHAQEAADAQSELGAAEQAESQLKQSISEELAWDSVPTVKDLRDARSAIDGHIKTFEALQALLPGLLAAQPTLPPGENLGRAMAMVNVEEPKLVEQLARYQEKVQLLDERADQFIAALDITQKAGVKAEKAHAEAAATQEALDTALQVYDLGYDTQVEFLESAS